MCCDIHSYGSFGVIVGTTTVRETMFSNGVQLMFRVFAWLSVASEGFLAIVASSIRVHTEHSRRRWLGSCTLP